MTPNDDLTPFWHDDTDLTRFPAALRALVNEELAAGNHITEIGHGFPAPPVGAYVKLAAKVSSRPRASSDGIDFCERNGSSYSGEFADERRFFFVLEPPAPPPPEPDMDAIRAAHAPKPDPLGAHAMRWESGPPHERPAERAERSFSNTETATGWTRVLHFVDRRPPHEVQAMLERTLTTLFVPRVENGELSLHATATVIGARYTFELRFVAARSSPMRTDHHYVLRVIADWGDQTDEHRDYYRKTSDSWYRLWTRDLMGASPPPPGEGSPERYRELVSRTLSFESELNSVEAIQRAIVRGLRQGGAYSTSHKEGGTTISWRVDRYVRSDYGEETGTEEFTDDATFLEFLRRFFAWEVGRNQPPGTVPDIDAWRLLLRRLHPPN